MHQHFEKRFAVFLNQRSTVHSLLVLAGVGIALGGCASKPPADNVEAQPSPASPVASTSIATPIPVSLIPGSNSNFIVAAVQKVGPAVVRIDSSRTVTTQVPEGFNDPFFRRFFGQSQPSSKEVVRGVGSGFIITSDGKILTNSHVVNGVTTVNVTLKDGRSFKGQVLGQDSVTDVAVVKIPANNLPSVTMGNPNILQAGDWAIAIGNPLGLDNTVTSGIISATKRSSADIGVSRDPVNFIQTDAAINPGNSGGPLLNANGQVIGINTAIISGAQGIGFAIPIDTAQTIAQQLITKGKVEHSYLGVEMVVLTPEVKQKIDNASNGQIRISADNGILILRVLANSPAAAAGLQQGDVILKINDQSVTKTADVQRLVESTQVGNKLQMEIQRNGQSLKVAVKTAPLPQQLAQPEE